MERPTVDRLRADEKLIEMVKRYPCLWQIHSKCFRDLSAKETAWKIVSDEVETQIDVLFSIFQTFAMPKHTLLVFTE